MPADLTSAIAASLPYLRRYARALTGTQTSGDRFAAATLEALLEDMPVVADTGSAKVALFRAFHLLWSSAGAPVGEADAPLAARAQRHMARLVTPNSREALLLSVIEEFNAAEIGQILDTTATEAAALLDTAIRDMEESVTGRVMIIITAFPERLLTGEQPEPAFLITKPFSEEQLRSAVSQAMFFSSTETLAV